MRYVNRNAPARNGGRGGNGMLYSLEGLWEAELSDGVHGVIRLPGTLDEAGLGHGDALSAKAHPTGEAREAGCGLIATRLTRRHSFEGEARLTREIEFDPPGDCRVFLEAERARCLRLLVNGREAPHCVEATLSTPHIFEITGLAEGPVNLTLLSDNSYPGLPREDILYASAATDETQTNWNGALGYVRLRVEKPVFIHAVRVWPRGDRVKVEVEIWSDRLWEGEVRLSGDGIDGATLRGRGSPGRFSLWGEMKLRPDAPRWALDAGNLLTLRAELEGYGEKTVRYGARDFGDDGTGRLALNGRRVFLRGETNCAVFPETGHPPMDAASWRDILETYRAYGVNFVRFHSWCPPEAAFAAADELGILIQPELSNWNPVNAFEDDAAWTYYRAELRQVLSTYANHPSFVMLALGNELAAGDPGHARMDALLDMARELDGTRLYANASNGHYGERGCDANSDFYTAMAFHGAPLRGTLSGTEASGGALQGHINGEYPGARTNYSGTMRVLLETCARPVFGFEVGQYEILPDFDQLARFRGVTDPANLRVVQDRAVAAGMMNSWPQRVEATGELALLCYREEVEAALRTPEMSGLALLGLQDFPGQGVALVGMLDSHLRPKPHDFARPERFRAFFRDELPLALLERYTWQSGEILAAGIAVANYGRHDIDGPLRWRLTGESYARSGELPGPFPAGRLTEAGTIRTSLDVIERPLRLELALEAGGAVNRYPLWVYPSVEPRCPGNVATADTLEEALPLLAGGERVLLDPPPSVPLRAVRTGFSTDFWSVGTFPCQSGSMGQLIDAAHPLFRGFPTERHTNWQWWPMAVQRAVIVPAELQPIVTAMDSIWSLRPMAQLFECRVGEGRLMFSSCGLRRLNQYPEARALLDAVYRYMGSEAFAPRQSLTTAELEELFEKP